MEHLNIANTEKEEDSESPHTIYSFYNLLHWYETHMKPEKPVRGAHLNLEFLESGVIKLWWTGELDGELGRLKEARFDNISDLYECLKATYIRREGMIMPESGLKADRLTEIIEAFILLDAYKKDRHSLIELVLLDKFNQGGLVVRVPDSHKFDIWLVNWTLEDIKAGRVPEMIRRVDLLAKGNNPDLHWTK
jgi:hypothetical protein